MVPHQQQDHGPVRRPRRRGEGVVGTTAPQGQRPSEMNRRGQRGRRHRGPQERQHDGGERRQRACNGQGRDERSTSSLAMTTNTCASSDSARGAAFKRITEPPDRSASSASTSSTPSTSTQDRRASPGRDRDRAPIDPSAYRLPGHSDRFVARPWSSPVDSRERLGGPVVGSNCDQQSTAPTAPATRRWVRRRVEVLCSTIPWPATMISAAIAASGSTQPGTHPARRALRSPPPTQLHPGGQQVRSAEVEVAGHQRPCRRSGQAAL